MYSEEEERSKIHQGANGEEVASRFHMFDDIEESDINIIHLESPRRPHVRHAPKVFLHYLDLTFGQLDFFILWRFCAIAFNLCVRWSTGSVYVLNFILAFFVALCSTAWPVAMFEFGISVASGRENAGAMASLGTRSRVSGLNWLFNVFLLLTTVPLAAYAGLYAMDASDHHANFSSPGYKAQDALDLYVGRECTNYQDYVPHLSPLLCGPEGKRMDISCYDEDQCHLWSGNGRCLAVPWAPASEYLLTSRDEYDPILDQDYPHYCAARALHDISTNHAKAVINHKGLVKDWKGTLTSRLPLAISLVLLLAGALTILSAAGVQGTRTGSVCRISAQLVRSIIGMAGFVVVAVLLMHSIYWYNHGKTSLKTASGSNYYNGWNHSLGTINLWDFFHPDVWAYSMIQSLMMLRAGSGRNELQGSRMPEKSHMILGCFLHLVSQTVMCVMIFLSCWLAYGVTALKSGESATRDTAFAVMRFDLRNNPYGTIFTSLQTMFDNTAKLNGGINDTHNFGTVFWIVMACLGVNGVSISLDTISGNLALSAWNWRGGRLMNTRRQHRRADKSETGSNKFTRICDMVRGAISDSLSWCFGGSPRWVYVCIITVLAWVISIQEWFGGSWGMTVIYHQFSTHLLYPFIIIYHCTSMAWLVMNDLLVKHFGRAFTYVQMALFYTGSAVAGFCVCATWRNSPVYSPIIGGIVGMFTMLSSFVAPYYFIKTHDAHGRRHSKEDILKTILFGFADDIRTELNSRCCHTNRVARVSMLTTLGVRYVVPSAMVLALANILTSSKKLLWHFSPYIPFDFQHFNDQFLIMQKLMSKYDLIRAPTWLIILAAIGPLFMIVVLPLYFVWPARLDWIVPYDVDDTYFQVKEAIEKFADKTQLLTQAPIDDDISRSVLQSGVGTRVGAPTELSEYQTVL